MKPTLEGKNPTVINAVELNMASTILAMLEMCPVFKDIVSMPRIMRMRTALPENGWKLEHAELVVSEFAEGISGTHLAFNVHTLEDKQKILDKINSTQILLAGLFDYLIAQGDRHGENLHIDSEGNIKLIDNFDKSFMYVNSFMIPQTYIYERIYVSNGALRSPRTGQQPAWSKEPMMSSSSWGLLPFDYRCHTPNQKLGMSLPAGVAQCMNKIVAMSTEELAATLHIDPSVAIPLRLRAAVLKADGFEEALKVAASLKPRPHDATHKDGRQTRTYRYYTKPDLFELETFQYRKPCCKLVPRSTVKRTESMGQLNGGLDCEGGADANWEPPPGGFESDSTPPGVHNHIPENLMDVDAMLNKVLERLESKSLS